MIFERAANCVCTIIIIIYYYYKQQNVEYITLNIQISMIRCWFKYFPEMKLCWSTCKNILFTNMPSQN